MPLFKNYKAIISNVLMLLLFSANVKAQVKGGGTGTSYSCTGCTTIITSPASTNFSVNVGQIVCIAPNVTYTGNITLNGGTICNQGTLTRVVFKSGVFNNLGTFVTAAGLSIAASNDLLINCYNRSTFAVKGGLNLRSIYTGDSIIITLHENSLFTTNTSFTSRNTILKIYNGSQNEYPQSYFNVGTDFSIGDSTDFRLDNWNDFNIGRNINFTATGNKRINNYYSYSLSSSRFIPSYMNLFNVNGSFNISGTGNTTDKVIIDNYNPTFNITKNLTSSIANAKVKIINESFINSSPLTTNFYVGQSVTLNNLTDTILNNGLFKANLISISRGTFINQGDFYSNSDLKVINGGKFFNNFIINTVRSGEVISPVDANAATSRNLIVNTQGLFSNKLGGIVTIARNLIVNTQGLFSNKSFAKISNNTSLNSGTVTNDSIIYAGALTLQNLSQALNTGTLSGGNILLSNSIFTTTKKVIADSSIKALTNSTLTNSGILTANGNIQITTSTFSNSSTVSAGKDILIQSNATATNNGSVTATRNVKITSASLTNNNYVLANNNLDVANSVAIYNNNGFTEVSDSLHNVGVINLGQGSFVNTANYYNVSTGTISAPASVSDTASYAKLIISGVSNNATYINGRVIVHDQTLVSTISNIGYGFDQISNANRIGNTVLFAAKSVAPGTGTGGGSPTPVSSCPLIAALYQLNASASSTAICPGASVNLSSQLNFQIFSIIFPINIPSNSYTWSPTASFSNPTQQNQVVSPTSTTTYTVKVSVFPGCFFTKTVNIVVTPNTAVIAANQTGLLCFSSTGLVLNSTITSGGLSTLQWYLNGNPISGATNANYTPTQAGTYLLNVSGTCGVANSNAITIFPKPTVSISSNFLGICNGNPITLTANLGANSGSGIVYQWTQNTSNVGTNANTYLASSAGNYAVTATNSNGCVGNSNSITIAVSANLFANAGPDQIYVSTPVSIGGNPSCATGGVTPYSYAWSTTAGFVSGAVNQCNNTVAPSATTIYTLTVTDASGCQAKDDVQVVRIGNVISYIVPKKSVDGGYQIPVTNKVYFKFDEEYKNNTISYKIFDYNITAPGNQPANVLCGLNTSLKNLGDNRYYIDLTTCAGSLSASKYYLVEVTNDKNEKFFFKFLN